MTATDRLLERLEAVKSTGDRRWAARCPAHDDHKPSLVVTEKATGDVLIHCHAGCDQADVVGAMGLELRDLFAEPVTNGHRDILAEYDYTTESGELLFQVVRFAPKDFRQRRPDGVGGWEWSLNGTRRVLYRLPRVVDAVERGEDIIVVEGEKDVEALERLGIVATTCPMGAGKWRPEYSESLRGAKVTIVADRDEPGRVHARELAESLQGKAESVELVEPAVGKDVSDHLAAGRSIGALVPVEFLSARRESTRAERNGLPFRPLGEAIANAPAEPAWQWDGYVAPGAITLLAGRPKVGKSTLDFGLFEAITTGAPFLGLATRRTGVLLLSEEREGTLAEKARRFNLNGSVHLLMRHELQGQPWPEVVKRARSHCREHGLEVLAIDTLDKWTGLRGDDENKAGPVLEALQPLMEAAGDGLGVLVASHQRKASGDHGEAVRGSNALTGTVDVIVELERVADVPNGRLLRGTSRFAGTPDELALELTEHGYVARGDAEALRARLDRERILALLSDSGEISTKEIAETAELPEGTVRKRLDELHDRATVERVGEGKRGSPYRWKFLSAQGNP